MLLAPPWSVSETRAASAPLPALCGSWATHSSQRSPAFPCCALRPALSDLCPRPTSAATWAQLSLWALLLPLVSWGLCSLTPASLPGGYDIGCATKTLSSCDQCITVCFSYKQRSNHEHTIDLVNSSVQAVEVKQSPSLSTVVLLDPVGV